MTSKFLVNLTFLTDTTQVRTISIDLSEKVSDLGKEQITISNAVVSNLSGDGLKYTFTATAIKTGPVLVKIDSKTLTSIANTSNEASNELSWNAVVAEASAPPVFSIGLVDTTNWLSDLATGSYQDPREYFGGASSYRRHDNYKNIIDDTVIYKSGNFIYHWHRDESTNRRFSLYKSDATFNKDQLGTKLLQLCSTWDTSPILLGASSTRVFFSGDYNCNGLADIIIVNLSNDSVTGLAVDETAISRGFVFNDKLIFQVYHSDLSASVKVTDGTIPGTSTFIAGNIFLATAAATGTYAVFIYQDAGVIKLARWTGSGAPAVSTPNGINNGWGASAAVSAGNYVLFVAKSSTEGHEIWRTDGTGGGTALHAIFYPGATDGGRQIFSISGNRALLVGNSASGIKFAISDGTTVTNYSPSVSNTFGVQEIFELQNNKFVLTLSGTLNRPQVGVLDTASDSFSNLTSSFTGYAFNFFVNHCRIENRPILQNFNGGLFHFSSDGSYSIISTPLLSPNNGYIYPTFGYAGPYGLNCIAGDLYSDTIYRINSDYVATASRKGSSISYINDFMTPSNYLLAYFEPTGSDMTPNYSQPPLYSVSKSGTMSEMIPSGEYISHSQLGNLKLYIDHSYKLQSIDIVTGTNSLVKDLTTFAGLTFATIRAGTGPYLLIHSDVGLLRTDGTSARTIMITNTITSTTNFFSLVMRGG